MKHRWERVLTPFICCTMGCWEDSVWIQVSDDPDELELEFCEVHAKELKDKESKDE